MVENERAEHIMGSSTEPSFAYVTYIASTAEKVWHALTDADCGCR